MGKGHTSLRVGDEHRTNVIVEEETRHLVIPRQFFCVLGDGKLIGANMPPIQIDSLGAHNLDVVLEIGIF